MQIIGNDYTIAFDSQKTLALSGKLTAMPEEYQKIEDFFEKVLDTISKNDNKELTLDLRELMFLNSSGIKSICISLVMEADDLDDFYLKILCKDSVTWQVETIPTFKDLMKNLEIVFE